MRTTLKHPQLQNLVLADSNPKNLPLDIDILIGCQDYWNFMGIKQIRDPSGLVAIETKLGFVLSGPILGCKAKKSSENVYSSHFMRV